MKDDKQREKGRYSETFTKVKDNVTYTMIETTIVGRDYEVMNYQREFNPGLKYPMSWEQL